jgi:hypothetical protein
LEEREKTGREWRKGRRRRRHEEGGLRSDKNRGREGGREETTAQAHKSNREGGQVGAGGARSGATATGTPPIL